jgi:hypothetical protein
VDTHTFEQLLEQQRAGIKQIFETVIYSIVLGVTANQIYDSLLVQKRLDTPFWWALAISAAFFLQIIYRIMRAKRKRLPVKEIDFQALFLFDQDAEHRAPIQMPNYELSIWANNDWNEVFSKNQQLRQSYLDSETQRTHPFDHRQGLQSQVQIQYLEYAMLREFCDLVRVPGNAGSESGRHLRGPSKWLRQAPTPIARVTKRIQRLLCRFPIWKVRCQQARIAAEMVYHFGHHPITSLPDGMRNNVWVQAMHGAQPGYEKQVLAGGQLMSWGYAPFTLVFPFKTHINHQITGAGRRTTFATKYGELSLHIRETGRRPAGLLGDSFHYAPHLRPQEHPYLESIFEVTVSFSISQFHALKPWLSDEFDRYYIWAQDRMQALESKFSWDRYSSSVTRDEIRHLERILRGHDAQVQIEMLDNFPETIEGSVAKHIRWTRSFVWQHRGNGLEGLIRLASEVPEGLVEEIVLRLLRMSTIQYEDTVTPWKTVEALGVYGVRAQPSLAHRVYERLWETVQECPQETKQGVYWSALGKSLAQMQSMLPDEDQIRNVHRVVDQFLPDPIRFDEETCEQLWNGSSPEVHQKVQSFIEAMIRAQSIKEKRDGIEYIIALKKHLPPEFGSRAATELIAGKPRNVNLRIDIQRLIRIPSDELETEKQESIIKHVLRESKSAHHKIRAAATDTLRFQSQFYCKSNARIRSTIIRRLITLSSDDSDEVADRAVHALVSYVSCVPRRYEADVASIFLARVPPRQQVNAPNLLEIECSRGLTALVEKVPDDELKQEIKIALNSIWHRLQPGSPF